MDNKLKFTDDDKEKVVEFLNFIAKHAEFNGIKVKENIEFFKLLSYMQQNLLMKIDANVLEIKKVYEAKQENNDVESPQDKE